MTLKSEGKGQRKAIILIVDSNPHVRELLSHFLQEAGCAVEFEADGVRALERAREVIPDIIITEILVPVLDGLALCRKLRADPKTRGVAILVFSVLAVGGRAREAGADAFLQKPLSDQLLVDTVRQLLEAPKENSA